MLYLIGTLGADGAGYKSVEFYGSVRDLSISERMTMTNLAMEMGVKCAFVPPDEKTAEYLNGGLTGRAGRYRPVCRMRMRCMNARSTSTSLAAAGADGGVSA